MVSKFKLPTEHVAKLQQSQRDLHDIVSEFTTAEECGLDCQEYRRLHTEAADRIGKILQNYGPPVS